MTAIRGAAAALTGAASGIGRALALELAARGCDLALADRDQGGLAAVSVANPRAPGPAPPVESAGRWRLNLPRAAAIWRWPTATKPGLRRSPPRSPARIR